MPTVNAPWLQDVTSRIGAFVHDFCILRLDRGKPEFHADDLRRFVAERAFVAPGSADRVLRLMRKRGEVKYRCINRAQSLYRLEWVKE